MSMMRMQLTMMSLLTCLSDQPNVKDDHDHQNYDDGEDNNYDVNDDHQDVDDIVDLPW